MNFDVFFGAFATALASFFAIMNPIANTPIFLGLTDAMTSRQRLLTALKSLLLAWLIISIFMISGPALFSLFGISIGAFRITGGLLIALVGYHMLQGKPSSVTHNKHDGAEVNSDDGDSWLSPLAIPILAGPGAIATGMSLTAHVSWFVLIATNAALMLVCIVSFFAFVGAEKITKILGANAMQVITKLMGMILAVIGIEMVIGGVRNVLGQ